MSDGLILREGAPPSHVTMSAELAARLTELQIATVLPTGEPDRWTVSDVRKVGVAVVAGTQVTIHPKTPIRNLMYLMGFSPSDRAWRDDDVQVAEDQELVPAIARAFSTLAHRALARGAVRDYHEVERSEMTLRGRWDVTAQLTRRLAVPAPLELIYDEYDGDIAENRILLTAALRCLAFPGIPARVRVELLQVVHRLDGVTPLARTDRVPSVVFTRRNSRYRASIGLGRTILRGLTVQNESGAVGSHGFLLTMSSVFEDFLASVIGSAAAAHGLRTSRHDRLPLDNSGLVWVEPDLLLRGPDGPLALVDAKYKLDHEGPVRNPDVYQVVTYALRHGLTAAHLVYVGDGTRSRSLRIIGSGVTVHTHAVDLSLGIDDLVDSIDALVAALVTPA